MEKVSLIVPAYNAGTTIKRCLDSLVNQTYADIEIIVINDGSTDETLQILNKYRENYPFIHVIDQKNAGVSVARNNGLVRASGNYIMFVDSDDSLTEDACEKAISEIGTADLLLFGLNIFEDGKLIRTPHLQEMQVSLNKSQEAYWDLRKINLGPCNKLYRRERITNLFDETLSLGEDTKFVIDYLTHVDSIRVIPDCLYNVNLDNQGSLNRKYREDRLDQLLIVRNIEKKFLENRYGKASYLLYNEYFLDLHVILFDIVSRKKPFSFLKMNISKFDYSSIIDQCRFPKKYYVIFSKLVSLRLYCLIYLLLCIRKIILQG